MRVQGAGGSGMYMRPVSARAAEAAAVARGAPAPNLALTPAFWAGRAAAGVAAGAKPELASALSPGVFRMVLGGEPAAACIPGPGVRLGAGGQKPAEGLGPAAHGAERPSARGEPSPPHLVLTVNPDSVTVAGGGPPTPAQAPAGLPQAPGSGQSELTAPGWSPDEQETLNPASAPSALARTVSDARAAPGTVGNSIGQGAAAAAATLPPLNEQSAAVTALLAPLLAMAQARAANAVAAPEPSHAAPHANPGPPLPEWTLAWLAASRPLLGLGSARPASAPAGGCTAPGQGLVQGQGQGQGQAVGAWPPQAWQAVQLLASLPAPILAALPAQLGVAAAAIVRATPLSGPGALPQEGSGLGTGPGLSAAPGRPPGVQAGGAGQEGGGGANPERQLAGCHRPAPDSVSNAPDRASAGSGHASGQCNGVPAGQGVPGGSLEVSWTVGLRPAGACGPCHHAGLACERAGSQTLKGTPANGPAPAPCSAGAVAGGAWGPGVENEKLGIRSGPAAEHGRSGGGPAAAVQHPPVGLPPARSSSAHAAASRGAADAQRQRDGA